MKLPAPINDVSKQSTSKSNGKNPAAPLNTQKKFHTKPIKKLPKRNMKKPEVTTLTPVLDSLSELIPDTISSTLIDSLDNSSLDTLVLLDTPIQQEDTTQDWCILESIGTTDKLSKKLFQKLVWRSSLM